MKQPALSAPSRRQLGIISLALLVFVVAMALRIFLDDREHFAGLPFVIPIALIAFEFGRKAGVFAAAVSMASLLAWWSATGDPVDAVGIFAPSACFLFLGVLVGDLSTRRRQESAEIESWFELSTDLLATGDFNGYFTALNPSWERTLGQTPEVLMGRPYIEFVHPDDRESVARAIASQVAGSLDVRDFENRFLAGDGSWHWLLWSSRADDRQIYAVAKDITERKVQEIERERLLQHAEGVARTDQLTGLANRRAWDEAVLREVSLARRRKVPISVLMIDIDDLKSLNDTHGHQAGDAMLQKLTSDWSLALRTTDFAARYGGDEFGILLPDCEADYAEGVYLRLDAVTTGHRAWSAGIAHWDGIESSHELVARADAALYEAKDRGGGRAVTAESPQPGPV